MPEWREEIRNRLAGLNLAAEREAKVVEELADHMDERYRALVARGTSDNAARSAVLAELSDGGRLADGLKRAGLSRAAESVSPGSPARAIVLADLAQDVAYAIRVQRKNAGFTVFAVLTLTLGIGANSAILSVVNTVLLRPLPYPDQKRIVTFWLSAPMKGLPKLSVTQGHAA